MTRRILGFGALLITAGCLFKGPDFYEIVGIDDGIPVPQPGDVVGRVRVDGMGVAGVMVTLSGAAGRTTTTNASGDYAFEDVTSGGQATVTITPPAGVDCPTISRTVTVPDGGTARADFDCTTIPTTGTVTGTVTGNGSPLSGATVTLNGSTTTTDAGGNFTFSGVAPGQKTLTTTASGFDCPGATVNVVAGQTATATVACTTQSQSLTAGDLAGNWSWLRTRTSTTGSCVGPIPTADTGSISNSGNQLTVTGLHPDVVLTGQYDMVSQMSTTTGTVTLPNSFRLQVSRVGTYSRVSGGQIQMTGQMEVQHFPPGSSSPTCTENYGVGGAQAMISSAAFKHNVVNLLPGDFTLLGLRPVAFRYRAEHGDPGVPRIGLIAEDVAEVYPGAVVYAKDGRTLGIHYPILTGLLIGEMERRVERSLATEIDRWAGGPQAVRR